ncbi:TPA: ABC transporter substrate-binding protein, partial [Staphylococcus aureus]|nr:ABC transporter substrate-binding protein [Staphylococcus aureus]
MKRLIGILLCSLFILTACSTSVDKTSDSTKTIDYKIENGKTLKVPEKPKRVAVLTGFYVGDFIKLGIKPIAVSDITKDSSILKPYLKGVDYIGENDVEKVAKAKPDLIVVDAMDKNIKKYQKIAPTVPYTYNK